MLGQIMQFFVVHRRSYRGLPTNWHFRVLDGISITVTAIFRPAILKQRFIATPISLKMNGRIKGNLLSLEFGGIAFPLHLSQGATVS